jgi:hypothetical protein
MLDRRYTCVPLSHPYLTWSIHAFDHNVHHRGHCAAAACGSLKPLPADRLRGTLPHLSNSMKLALLLGTTEGPTLIDYVAIANRVVCRRLILLTAHLEKELCTQLDKPGRIGRDYLAEAGTPNVSIDRLWSEKLGVVEGVESLQTKLQRRRVL